MTQEDTYRAILARLLVIQEDPDPGNKTFTHPITSTEYSGTLEIQKLIFDTRNHVTRCAAGGL